MSYIVWTEEYEGSWNKGPVPNLDKAKELILNGMKEGKTVLLTREVPFSLEIITGKDAEKVDLEQELPEIKGAAIKKKEVKGEATPSETE